MALSLVPFRDFCGLTLDHSGWRGFTIRSVARPGGSGLGCPATSRHVRWPELFSGGFEFSPVLLPLRRPRPQHGPELKEQFQCLGI